MMAASASPEGRFVGRYAIYGEIASGGMATVHYGRLFGTAGFSRTVAIKRLHPQLAKDPDFVAMFLDEAHVAARIRHPNVVPTLDVVSMQDEIFIVMEYVQGESLWRLMRIDKSATTVPPRIACAIMANVLHGLHAAHEATNESGEALGIVHRDVSPQNILIGKDGSARVLDFGIAKARDRIHVTRGGELKGKVSYMAPEQLKGQTDRRTDVYAAGVVLWEALTGRKLFVGEGDFATADKVRTATIDPPSVLNQEIPAALDALVLRATARSAADRFETASEMATILEREIGVASASEVASWVATLAGEVLATRSRTLTSIERSAPMFAPSHDARIVSADPDPDGLAPTRAIDVGPLGEATEVSLSRAVAPASKASSTRALLIASASLAVMGIASVATYALTHHASPQISATVSAPILVAPPSATTAVAAVSAIPTINVVDVDSLEAVDAGSRVRTPPHDPCKPPYVIDARGVRHLKRECMR